MAVVEVENVSRVYEEKGQLPAQALRGVSLKVEKGEFMALSGPSGSGKTTLLNLIGGLDQVSSGEIRIDGRALSGLSRKDLADLRRDRIGYVFQAYNLVPVLTASENAAYVLELRGVSAAERRARVKAVFERIGLGAHLDSKPLKMSGGQQQRVAVARAIVAEPAVILADEPTANLDQATGAALMDLMRELNQSGRDPCARSVRCSFSVASPRQRSALKSRRTATAGGSTSAASTSRCCRAWC